MKLIHIVLLIVFSGVCVNSIQPVRTQPAPDSIDAVPNHKLFQVEEETPRLVHHPRFHRRHMRDCVRVKIEELMKERFDKRETIDGTARLFVDFTEREKWNTTLSEFKSLFTPMEILFFLKK